MQRQSLGITHLAGGFVIQTAILQRHTSFRLFAQGIGRTQVELVGLLILLHTGIAIGDHIKRETLSIGRSRIATGEVRQLQIPLTLLAQYLDAAVVIIVKTQIQSGITPVAVRFVRQDTERHLGDTDLYFGVVRRIGSKIHMVHHGAIAAVVPAVLARQTYALMFGFDTQVDLVIGEIATTFGLRFIPVFVGVIQTEATGQAYTFQRGYPLFQTVGFVGISKGLRANQQGRQQGAGEGSVRHGILCDD